MMRMEQRMLDFQVKGLALDEQSQMPVVILQNTDKNKVLSLTIGPFEASAIIVEMEGVHTPRPLTHDLFSELFQRHRFQLLSIEIYGRTEDEYLARMRYKTRVSTHIMEVRPSDGIALALRLNAPILVDQRISSNDVKLAALTESEEQDSRDVLYLETPNPGIQFM